MLVCVCVCVRARACARMRAHTRAGAPACLSVFLCFLCVSMYECPKLVIPLKGLKSDIWSSTVVLQDIVHLPPSFSAALREHLRIHGRPFSAEPTLEYGVLMPDLTTFPGSAKPSQGDKQQLSHGSPHGPGSATLCVELKPKWGCAMDELNQDLPDDGQPRLSRYHMKQHLKLAQVLKVC
jgi:hypothetical protein